MEPNERTVANPARRLAMSGKDTLLFVSDTSDDYDSLRTYLVFHGYDVHCIRTDDNYAESDYYAPLKNVCSIDDVKKLSEIISDDRCEQYLITAFLEFAACDACTFSEARELAEMTADGEFGLVSERFGYDGYMLDDAHRRLMCVSDEDDEDRNMELALRCAHRISEAMAGLIELSTDRDDTDISRIGERRRAYFIISDEPAGRMAAMQIAGNECAAYVKPALEDAYRVKANLIFRDSGGNYEREVSDKKEGC